MLIDLNTGIGLKGKCLIFSKITINGHTAFLAPAASAQDMHVIYYTNTVSNISKEYLVSVDGGYGVGNEIFGGTRIERNTIIISLPQYIQSELSLLMVKRHF